MKQLPTPVVMYLEKLELALKRRVGVSPEDELCDAREHLCREFQEITDRHPGSDDTRIAELLAQSFGDPEDVAAEFGTEEASFKVPGHAPRWRICCTRCGRSAPAAKTGVTRIAGFGEKHVVGWCRACGFFRWVKILNDLDKPTLTKKLGVHLTPEQLRERVHTPWRTVVGLVASILVAVFVAQRVFAVAAQTSKVRPAEAAFENMPEGWRLVQSSVIPLRQTRAISKKFDVDIERLSNNLVTDGDGTLQINVARCGSPDDAKKLHRAFSDLHPNLRDCILNGHAVIEFVRRTGETRDLYLRARYELGLQPKTQRYLVEFDAAPVVTGDYSKWNKLFNLFLLKRAGHPVQAEIAKLASDFEFGNTLLLKRTGVGGAVSKWKTSPLGTDKFEINEPNVTLHFTELEQQADVPFVSVRGQITSTTGGATPRKGKSNPRLLESTKHWPIGDESIQKLAKEITANAVSDEHKIELLLQWFGKNIRYKGATGSRYGVSRVLQQRHGHCWDYSDLFITLARAAGIPATQVAGWLYRSEGHIWCRVLVDGEWRQVDPTTGTQCGSDYVPFAVTEDGNLPFLYTSMPVVRLVD